jgi:hypothetical protein
MILDPDVVRIRESYQTECECIWIRILESGFRNFYADHRFASDPYHTVRTPSSGSDWARTSHVCKDYPASRSSVRTRECYAFSFPYAEATSIAVCCHYGVYADPRFFSIFQHRALCCVENSIVPLRLVSCHRCAVPRFDLLFGVLKGISQVSHIVVLNLRSPKVAPSLCAFRLK